MIRISTTVNAAEHADYARSHIFEYVIFGGSLDPDASNRAIVRATAADYPGAYNVDGKIYEVSVQVEE